MYYYCVMFIKKVDDASPCEAHVDIFGSEGKFPRVPDDVGDAMSNGSSNSSSNDDVGAKCDPSVP